MIQFFDFLIVALFVLCWLLPIGTSSILTALIARTFLSLIPFCAGLWGCHWKKRYESDQYRKELLQLPIQTYRGELKYPRPYDTGKKQMMSVPTGYSQEGITGEFYWHYKYEWSPIYNGQVATVYNPKDITDHFDVRTLPQDFFCTEETIPNVSGVVNVDYVTAPDGTRYFIRAWRS